MLKVVDLQLAKAIAPFSYDQVWSLNAFQDAHVFHPFTCPNRNKNHPNRRGDEGMLVATVLGWVCQDCAYTQLWAWEWMADWSWHRDTWTPPPATVRLP